MRAGSFFVACALALTLTASSTASAVPAEFSKPTALVPNVAFWKKVYIEWSINDIALHDEEDLGMVYRVVKVPARGAKNEKGLDRAGTINAARAEVVAALATLQKKQPKDESGLTDVEKAVFLALKGSTRADKYQRVAKIRAQNGLRERFIQGYQSSGLYEPFITAELTRVGLPKELIGIAFVESLFHTGAKSKVGAAGVWQFMSYTGREYMQLNPVIDERWDPILATEAAAKYLKSAKKELGIWPLAVTSYNYGRAGMKGLASAAGTNDFNTILAVTKGKRFGFAARNYYASVLAVLEILDEAPTRLAGVQKKPAWSYDVIRMPFQGYASQIVGTGLLDQATFDWLNPALSDAASKSKLPLPHGIGLRVPKGKAKEVLAKLDALPSAEKMKGMMAVKAIHTCTGKQSITDIAKKYSMGADILAARTGVPVDAVPAKGQKLPIPAPTYKYTLFPEARGMPLPPVSSEAPPLLLADAAQIVDETPEPEVPTKAKTEARRPEPKPEVALTGTIKVVRMRAEALPAPLPAVDVMTGAAFTLPMPDVLVGLPPVPAATLSTPTETPAAGQS
jgi:membrane-bound lytic murein transglycosylase D